MICRDDSLLERNKTVALLKQCGCSIRVVDNGLTLSRIRQNENVIRYWFDDVFVIRSCDSCWTMIGRYSCFRLLYYKSLWP